MKYKHISSHNDFVTNWYNYKNHLDDGSVFAMLSKDGERVILLIIPVFGDEPTLCYDKDLKITIGRGETDRVKVPDYRIDCFLGHKVSMPTTQEQLRYIFEYHIGRLEEDKNASSGW